MDNAGITAQYGFLFQRKAFILHALENANTKQVYTFEGKDDIDITAEESLRLYQEPNARYVQVKSGHVDETCFSKVICNWFLLDADVNAPLHLICENPLEFSLDDTLIKESKKVIGQHKLSYHFFVIPQYSLARKNYSLEQIA